MAQPGICGERLVYFRLCADTQFKWKHHWDAVCGQPREALPRYSLEKSVRLSGNHSAGYGIGKHRGDDGREQNLQTYSRNGRCGKKNRRRRLFSKSRYHVR